MSRKPYERPAIVASTELEQTVAAYANGLAAGVDAASIARLRRIERAAERLVALHDANARAQALSASGRDTSPAPSAPPRRAILDAERALREAVRR